MQHYFVLDWSNQSVDIIANVQGMEYIFESEAKELITHLEKKRMRK